MAFKKKIVPVAPQSPPVQISEEEKAAMKAPITSFSLQKRKGYWHVVTIVTQDDKIVSIDYGKPAPKAATLIQFRITVGKFIMKHSA